MGIVTDHPNEGLLLELWQDMVTSGPAIGGEHVVVTVKSTNALHGAIQMLSRPSPEPVGYEGVVECVARAICESEGLEADEEVLQGTPHWVAYLTQARAALAALGLGERHDG